MSNCNQDDENNNDMEELITQLDDFSVTQKFFGYDNQTGIAIDENRKKVCLINNHQEDVSFRVYSYRDLLSAEIFEDGLSLTKTIRSSQIGGVLLGGLLLGSVGAIIGGLSGTKETSNIIKRIDLRLIMNDTASPIHDINYLELTVDRNDPEYKDAMLKIRHWYGLIIVLIKRADDEDKKNEKNSTQDHSDSIADEIKKLADLRDSGVLNEREFQEQKARLLK